MLQVIDLLLRSRVATAAGNVKGHAFANHSAEQLADRLARNTPEQIENREFHQSHGAPERQTLKFVIVLVAIHPKEVLFQIACVLSDEVWTHQPIQNRMKNVRGTVIHRDAFRAVLGTDPHKIITPLFEQLDGLDDDWIFEALEVEDRLGGSFLQGFVRSVSAFGLSESRVR